MWLLDNTFIILVGVLIILLMILHRNKNSTGSWSTIIENDIATTVVKKSKVIPKSSKGEIECKRVMENIFKDEFIKIRPDFLKSNRSNRYNNLELDCYNDKLKLAIEYNGVQHYKYTPFFHKTMLDFEEQQARDKLKNSLCIDNGITLINVPYTVKINEIESYLIYKLAELNLIEINE